MEGEALWRDTNDLAANPALKFAEGADDTGVIVSWNIEGPENKNEHSYLVQPNSISINPINWKRDDTYAPASDNLGDKLPVYDPKNPSMFALMLPRRQTARQCLAHNGQSCDPR